MRTARKVVKILIKRHIGVGGCSNCQNADSSGQGGHTQTRMSGESRTPTQYTHEGQGKTSIKER